MPVGEILLSFLAAVGAASLGWLLLGGLLLPWGPGVYVLLAAQGRGEGLERDLRALLWLGRRGLCPRRILLADCGLEGEGAALAALAARRPEVTLCAPAELAGKLKAPPEG